MVNSIRFNSVYYDLEQGWQSVTFLVRIRDFRIPDFLVKIDTDSRIPDSDYGFFKKTVKDAEISKKSLAARKQSCFIAYELNTLQFKTLQTNESFFLLYKL